MRAINQATLIEKEEEEGEKEKKGVEDKERE